MAEKKGITAWFPFFGDKGKHMPIPLEEFDQFVEISKEQFKKYEKGKTSFENIILAHKNSNFFKEGEQS